MVTSLLLVALKSFTIVICSINLLTTIAVRIGTRFPSWRSRRKVDMSRLSQTESAYVHQIFVRSCPDIRAVTRHSCIHFQTLLRSTDFRAFLIEFFSEVAHFMFCVSYHGLCWNFLYHAHTHTSRLVYVKFYYNAFQILLAQFFLLVHWKKFTNWTIFIIIGSKIRKFFVIDFFSVSTFSFSLYNLICVI